MLKDIDIRGIKTRELVAFSFAAGVVGALAVLLFGFILNSAGIATMMGSKAPMNLKAPEIYRPLFWGGLWGIPFGLILKKASRRFYLAGWLYFLAPVFGLYLVFAPMSGMGLFALGMGVPFMFYLLLVNLPYGITTALVDRWLVGSHLSEAT
jgi:hypothetical protein